VINFIAQAFQWCTTRTIWILFGRVSIKP